MTHRVKDDCWDGYVRIPASALSFVRLQHVVSQVDTTIAVSEHESGSATPAGICEWVGSWGDICVTVGWDWAVLANEIVLLNPSEIRTNILLVGESGRPERPRIAQLHLLFWIESHPWQQAVNDALGVTHSH